MAELRADPWSPEYGMGYEAPPEDSPLPRANPFVETQDWSRAIRPPEPSPQPVWFVDGVRRVELRLLASEDARRAPGLFGSYAVGSVHCDGRAAFDRHRVGRAVVVGGGIEQRDVRVACGAGWLEFEHVCDPGTDPNRPLERLQLLMRDAEENLAGRILLDGAPLVLVDGPLRLGQEGVPGPVGVVKRFVRRYLEPEQERLLGELGTGERTPVFALLDQQDAVRGYSWYTRLAPLRRPWHDHAGILRCEVRAAAGLQVALEMADRVSAMLPAYAGRPSDPRTPQNLAPVAGLESWLRHRMGDRAMVRRALLAWLSREAA